MKRARARSLTSAERRADAEARAEAMRRPERRTRAAFFIGTLGILGAVLGASIDPTHRFNGFLFGALIGIAIGIALRAWPLNEDYPSDYIDKSLD